MSEPMKISLTCEHGTRSVEIEAAYKWANPERALMPVCPYCDTVERPKAKCHARPWVPLVVHGDLEDE